MLIFATWWKQCTFTNIGHFSSSHRSSVIVTHVNTSTIFVCISNCNSFFPTACLQLCVCARVCVRARACLDNQYHSHTLAKHTDCGNSITMARRTFGKRIALRIFALETSRASSLMFIHSGSCMAGVIPKSLHLGTQVTLASLA